MVCFDMSNWLLCEELAIKTTVDHYLSFQIGYNDKWKDYDAFGSGKSHVEGKCHEVMSLCSTHVKLHIPLIALCCNCKSIHASGTSNMFCECSHRARGLR